MVMYWLTLGLMLVTLGQGKSLYDPLPPEDLKIRVIQRDENDPSKTRICVENLPEADSYSLSFLEGDQSNYPAEKYVPEDCLLFNIPLETWSDKRNLLFALHAEKEGNRTHDGVDVITHFPEIPLNPPTLITLGHDRYYPGMYILRMVGDDSNFVILQQLDQDTLIGKGNVSYYVMLNSTKDGRFDICYSTESANHIVVCDGTRVTVGGDDTDVLGPDPLINGTLVLDPEDRSKGTVEIEFTSTQPRYEYVVTSEDMSMRELCFDPEDCIIDRDASGTEIFKIRIVGLNETSHIKETNKNTFHDRDLILTKMNNDVLEAAWRTFGTPVEDKLYDVFLDIEDLTLETLSVECDSQLSLHCYGYFTITGIAEESHTITVRPQRDGKFLNLDKIQNTYIPLEDDLPEGELEIQYLDVARQGFSSKFTSVLCFSHITPQLENERLSHYEVLLINNKGQWRKHLEMDEDSLGSLCFRPFTIDPEVFDVHDGARVIVTQRNIDGFSVLARGETKLL